MAGEWTPINLGAVCSKIGSGATPRGGSDVYLESGPFALIRSQNVYNDGFHHDGLAHIGEKHATELDGVEVLKDDVLLNITGDSVARACQVDPRVLPARVNQHVAIIRPDSERLDPRFLRYFLVSPEMQAKLLSWAGSGGTRNALTKGMIESFDVPAPKDIEEQRAIAHILGTLDDKIELNRRMNETLEAITRALFKSWFVDFDPVRAKAEGRDPGPPQPLADLFPGSFEDSELGEIPRGWEVKSLDEIARFLNGLALQKYPPTETRSLPVIKIAQLRTGNTQGADQASADLDQDYVVADGDVLFSWSGSLECVLWAGGRGALNQHLFKVTSTTYPKWLYYLWIHQHLAEFRHIAASKATTMGHIQRHHLSGAKAVIPGFDLLTAADRHFGPLIDSIPRLLVQSRHLGVVRDELLPKLVSGAVRIENPEAFLGRRA
ncbi:MAG: restriction endonuclease subunit S [Gammaproteobacteria bacterium]|nr:restriction endonuclease subunit S [Gammaproteobacteria bacterium]